MSQINQENEETRTGDSSIWSHWLERLRRVFPSDDNDPRGSQFAMAIRNRFRDLYPLEDEEIGGVWYATLQALQQLGPRSPEVEARFLLSPQRLPAPETDVFAEPVHQPLSVQRDFNETRSQTTPRLFYLFTFTDLLPVAQNIKLFEESAIARLKNLSEHPPHSTLDLELTAKQ